MQLYNWWTQNLDNNNIYWPIHFVLLIWWWKKNYAKTKHRFSVILRAESQPQQQFDKLVQFHIGFAFADWQILDENNIIHIIKNKAEEALSN